MDGDQGQSWLVGIISFLFDELNRKCPFPRDGLMRDTQVVRCHHCGRSVPPEGPAGYDGDEPLCQTCFKTAERAARHERMRLRKEAMARDLETVRLVSCAVCGCDLLGESEEAWWRLLPKGRQEKQPDFPVRGADGRPYCVGCASAPPPEEPIGWSDLKRLLGGDG